MIVGFKILSFIALAGVTPQIESLSRNKILDRLQERIDFFMAFKTCLFPGPPDFETLHAAKLTEFPLEKWDYKPFSQGRICFAPDGLHVQFHCFEAISQPESEIRGVLRFTPDSLLTLSLYADGRFQVMANGINVPEGELHPFSGEDLQGVYWGGSFFVPASFLKSCFGFQAEVGGAFTGNFYKLCEAPEKPHYGSFYPADFTKPLDVPENLGDFIIISY